MGEGMASLGKNIKSNNHTLTLIRDAIPVLHSLRPFKRHVRKICIKVNREYKKV